MKKYNLKGIILKSRSYGEADKVFTIFTKNKGKISVFAKGVRRVKSRRGSNMDSLNYIEFNVSESTQGYLNLTEVATLDSFKNIKKDLKTASYAFYIAELLFKFLPEGDVNIELFELVVSTLKKLDFSTHPAQILNSFELKFMSLLGYDLVLDKCVNCDRNIEDSWLEYKFNINKGGFVCDNCQIFGVKVSADVASALYLLKFHKIALSKSPDFTGAHELIQFYIKEVLETDFNTHKFFSDV